MKFFAFTLVGLLFSTLSHAQTLKGRVTDISGNPIPAASVYIQEIKQGLICNAAGLFQINLAPGTYHIESRHIGFNINNEVITIEKEDLEIQIMLSEKEIQLQEVTIQAKNEDPAYAIMRKAIEKAPYYQSAIGELTYEVYSKGSGKLHSIPKLLEALAKKAGENTAMYKDKLFMEESVSEIRYTAPDDYQQKIIAYSSTFPNSENPKEASEIRMISLYRPMLGRIVSPLNPQAFSYYRFRYEDYDEENGQIINKIRIIPKLSDPRFMEGIIYIADDEWNIRHAEFTIHPPGQVTHYKFNYHQVLENIYLVTTYEANSEIGLLGLNLNADFLHSIQYTHIRLNDSLVAAETNQKKFEKKKEKKSLEIKTQDRMKKTVDSLAVKRDSLYWTEVRMIPLNDEELKSYARKDTIQAYVDSITDAEENPKFKFSDLIMGGKLGKDSTSLVRFSYSGLADVLTEYNFVDGLWLGQSFVLDFKKKKNTGLKISPAIHWASARKALIWKTDFVFDYAPEKLGQLYLSAGKISEDFSGVYGMDRMINAMYSLYSGKNYAKFYEKKYVQLSNQIDIANGLQLGLGLEWAKRRYLDNHTTWNIFKKTDKWTPNVPEYTGELHLEYSDMAKYFVYLQYTPQYYYRIADGKKQYDHSSYPTFEAIYQQGFKGGSGDNYSEFSQLRLSVHQRVKLGVYSSFNYRVNAGKFFNDNAFNYIDYKHFGTGGNKWVSLESWNNSYALLPYYTYSTNKEWLQAFAGYRTDYLLLKRIPYFQGKLFSEILQAKFLHTPDKKYYTEWGYSIGLGGALGNVGINAGAFVAFDSFKYNGFGLQLSMPVIGIFGR
ncbi:membrane protein [Bacteroidia bacterium]|nr:membrane protein [Bacteroidia bacterium]